MVKGIWTKALARGRELDAGDWAKVLSIVATVLSVLIVELREQAARQHEHS